MPFKSEKQRKWMWANDPEMAKKWEKEGGKLKREKYMKIRELIKKLVREELSETTKRDYKAEYKKFQSSDKSKKYRAELNKYNRQKGTYGNGDGKDASHKGGKIVGFEKESVNRGRAEKSRLKKEGKLSEGKFSKEQLNLLKLGYGSLNKLDPSSPTYKKFIKFLEKLPKDELKQLANADIKFVSMLAKNRIKGESVNEAHKSLPPFEIAKRMMKSKYWNKAGKGFQEKIIKKFRGRGVTPKSLDKWLPDYIDGKEISKLFEEKLTEAISGSDRKIMMMIVRDIIENLKKAGAKKPSNAVGRGVLSILRAMTYSKDNANYKNYKKYFPKTFNSKLTQKRVKQFHSQTDKVQLTMVKQAMNKVLGEGKLTEKKESAIDVVKRIVKNHQHEKGVDVQTANLILRIHSAYDKNPALQKKFEKMPLKKMAQGVWRFVK